MTTIQQTSKQFSKAGKPAHAWVTGLVAMLASGALAGLCLPGGLDALLPTDSSVASLAGRWVLACLIPVAYAPLLVVVLRAGTAAAAQWRHLTILVQCFGFWLAWAAVGYGWLLTVDLNSGFGWPSGWIMAVALGAWLFNAVYWAVVWTVPFALTAWATHRWPARQGGWPLWRLGVLMGFMALWWPVVQNRNITISWLTPALAWVNVPPVCVPWLAGTSYLQATLVVLGISGLAAWLWHHLPRRRWWLVGALLVYCAAMLGLLSIQPPRATDRSVLRGMVALQGNSPLASIRSTQSMVRRSLASHYQQLALQATQSTLHRADAATLLVLPEEGMLAYPVHESATGSLSGLARWKQVARQQQVAILLGAAVSHPTGQQTNELILLSDRGHVIGRQAKQWLVPFGEYYPGWRFWQQLYYQVFPTANPLVQFTPGPLRPPVMSVGTVTIGALNCIEVADERLAAHFKQQGADVLTVSANLGWFAIQTPLGQPLARQLLAHAQWRSLQTGLPVVLAANTGPSAIIQPTTGAPVVQILPVDTVGRLSRANAAP